MQNTLVEGQIDRSLDAPNRMIFEPKQKYEGRDMQKPIAWKPQNIELLSNTVSEVMVQKYQAYLAEALNEEADPIVYVDCSKKGDKDLMAYILERFIHTFVKEEDQAELVKDIIVRPSPLLANGNTARKDWADNYQGDNLLNDLFAEHAKLFWALCTQKEIEKEWLGEIYRIKFQGFMFFQMGQLMSKYGQRKNFLYIDHPENVTEFEQKGVNAFVQTRGQIGMGIDKFFEIKINNAKGNRKMYPPHSWNTLLEWHDYYTRAIDEDELTTGKVQ